MNTSSDDKRGEYPFILGSAGHIDHGKTTLVRALTGVDCDSLREEKKRGITIELGFAPLALPSGRIVSIVDVPGHERFIRQMVAGAAGIDAVMLVVASDEGVMPQTREHLDILTLLGVSRGLVVLSKTDLVDGEMRELARMDAEQLAAGTFLEGAPLLPVSSTTGEGIPALLDALENLVAAAPPRNRAGAFFLPVDRAFSVRGFGSVVTGTAYHGSVREGDDVEIVPSGLRTKVRSIQVHGAAAGEAVAGQRTALNLASVSLEELGRGDVVCAPNRFPPTECLDARLDALPSAPEPICHWQRLRLHIGTSDVVARVSLLGDLRDEKRRAIRPGESGLVQLLPELPIAAAMGERFVVRFYSPLRTIGGGEILLPGGSRPRSGEERAAREAILSALSRTPPEDLGAARLAALIRERGLFEAEDLFRLSQMERGDFAAAAKALGRSGAEGILRFGGARAFFCSEALARAALGKISAQLASFHKSHPERSGLSADELRQSAPPYAGGVFELKDVTELLRLFVGRGELKFAEAGGEICFHLPGFQPRSDERFMEAVAKLRDLALAKGFQLAEIASLPQETGLPASEISKALGHLKERAGLRIIGEGLLLPEETRAKLFQVILSIEGDLTVASLRDAIGASRKYALAILEFFDSQGQTKRVGDKRVVLSSGLK